MTYHYTECGLDYVWLENGYKVSEGKHGRVVSFMDIDGLHALIGETIARSKSKMKAEEVRFLRHELDLSQAALARLMGTEEQNVYRWEAGKAPISGPAQKLLAVLYLESIKEDSGIREPLEQLSQLDAETHRSISLTWENGWHDVEGVAA